MVIVLARVKPMPIIWLLPCNLDWILHFKVKVWEVNKASNFYFYSLARQWFLDKVYGFLQRDRVRYFTPSYYAKTIQSVMQLGMRGIISISEFLEFYYNVKFKVGDSLSKASKN